MCQSPEREWQILPILRWGNPLFACENRKPPSHSNVSEWYTYQHLRNYLNFYFLICVVMTPKRETVFGICLCAFCIPTHFVIRPTYRLTLLSYL